MALRFAFPNLSFIKVLWFLNSTDLWFELPISHPPVKLHVEGVETKTQSYLFCPHRMKKFLSSCIRAFWLYNKHCQNFFFLEMHNLHANAYWAHKCSNAVWCMLRWINCSFVNFFISIRTKTPHFKKSQPKEVSNHLKQAIQSNLL